MNVVKLHTAAPEPTLPDRFLSVNQVAEMMSLSRATIFKWVGTGRFPAGVKLGAKTVWRQSDLLVWMREQTAAAPELPAPPPRNRGGRPRKQV